MGEDAAADRGAGHCLQHLLASAILLEHGGGQSRHKVGPTSVPQQTPTPRWQVTTGCSARNVQSCRKECIGAIVWSESAYARRARSMGRLGLTVSLGFQLEEVSIRNRTRSAFRGIPTTL